MNLSANAAPIFPLFFTKSAADVNWTLGLLGTPATPSFWLPDVELVEGSSVAEGVAELVATAAISVVETFVVTVLDDVAADDIVLVPSFDS